MYLFFGGAVALLILLGSAFTLGNNYAERKCDRASLIAQIALKDKQLASIKAAAEADAKALQEAQAENSRLEDAARGLEKDISAGVCFSEPDALGLRKLWGNITVSPTRPAPR